MDHAKYSPHLKAVLHCYNLNKSFYSEISVQYKDFPNLIKISLYSDSYETSLTVDVDAYSENKDSFISKTRIVKYELINNISEEEALSKDSCCNTLGWDTTKHSINFVLLNKDAVKLYERTHNPTIIDINNIESEYFQNSTIHDMRDVESYYYMRDMYNHYLEFIPQGVGVSNRYSTEQKYNNAEFIDFITQKVWGLVALA